MEQMIKNKNEIMECLKEGNDYPAGLNCYKRNGKMVFETFRAKEEIEYLQQFFNIKDLNDTDDNGNNYYEISLPEFACPMCDRKIERNDNTPVTTEGWYGDWYFEWGNVGGVRTVKVTSIRCRNCDGDEHELDSTFDEEIR